MKNLFLVDMSYFLFSPYTAILRLAQEEKKSVRLLGLSSVTVLLCALSYYLAWFKILVEKAPLIVLAVNAVFFVLLFCLIVLLELSVTHLFVKKDKPLSLLCVFLVIAGAYAPYVFLSVVTGFTVNVFVNGVALCVAFIASLVLKYKSFLSLAEHFSASPWFLALVPFIFEMLLLFSGFAFFMVFFLSKFFAILYSYL